MNNIPSSYRCVVASIAHVLLPHLHALCLCCCRTVRLLTALLMTLAPQSVESQEAGLVENMLVFSLVAGLTLGALAGWLWLL